MGNFAREQNMLWTTYFRELQKFLLVVGGVGFLVLATSLNAAAKDAENKVEKPDFGIYVGLWKVKEEGGFLFDDKTVVWVISEKKGRLVINIPSRNMTFDEVKIEDGKIIAFNKTLNNSSRYETTSISLDIVEGMFAGDFDGTWGNVEVNGRLFPLYKKARSAEKRFKNELREEKKKLASKLEKIPELQETIKTHKKSIEDLKVENKNLRNKIDDTAGVEGENLKSLREQYKVQTKTLKRKHATEKKTLNRKHATEKKTLTNDKRELILSHQNQVKTLRQTLNEERKRAPRIDVGNMRRNAQAYRAMELRKSPSKNARSYFKLSVNQALVKLNSLDNGWSLVATDQGDLGFVPTTRVRSVTGARLQSPIPKTERENSGGGGEKVEDEVEPQIINLTQPKRGSGANRKFVYVPAPGFIHFIGSIAGSKVNSLKINGVKVKVVGGRFKHLMDIEANQKIQVVASTSDGQERLDLRVRVGSSN